MPTLDDLHEADRRHAAMIAQLKATMDFHSGAVMENETNQELTNIVRSAVSSGIKDALHDRASITQHWFIVPKRNGAEVIYSRAF